MMYLGMGPPTFQLDDDFLLVSLCAIFICFLEYGSYSIASFNRPAINVNSNILPSSFVSFTTGPILWALSTDLLSMWTSISSHLHLFAWILILFYGLSQSTSYQSELQYIAIFICLLECWSYSMGSLNRPAINVNFNIFPPSFICLNTGPILWALSIDLLTMWNPIFSHLHLFPSILVLFYGLFLSTSYQCELQYLATFICFLEYWCYSVSSFHRAAINMNSNMLLSSFVCLNPGPILWALSIDLLSMWNPISWHLHLFPSMLLLFYRLFQSTCYQCELQYLPIFICLLESWPYSMGSFIRPAIYVNSNILASSFLCLNTGRILWAPSIDLLSMWMPISCHLHLFPWIAVLFCRLFQSTCYHCEL